MKICSLSKFCLIVTNNNFTIIYYKYIYIYIKKFLFEYRSDQERTVHKVYNTVPFSLQHGGCSIEVLEPLSADILDLDVVSNTFEPIIPSFADHLWGFFTGKK